MSVYDKIQAGAYDSKLPYPVAADTGLGEGFVVEPNEHVRRRLKEARHEDDRRLTAIFKREALTETGLAGHPKAEAVYEKAWSEGHASGLCDVLSELKELAELVLP